MTPALLARIGMLIFLALPGIAFAHSKSVSYSEWSQRGENHLVARVALTARQATLLMGAPDAPGDPAEAAARAFQQGLSVATGGMACARREPARHLPTRPGSIVLELTFACAAPLSAGATIQSDAFFDLAAGHLHFARLRTQGRLIEAALSADARRFVLPPVSSAASAAAAPRQAGAGAFFISGVEHILGGLDHLAFLAAVLLTVQSARGAVLAVTGFTLGHSISLAAAVGGLVSLNASIVEALIAFSIWLVAVEILLRGAKDKEARDVIRTALGLALIAGAALPLLAGAPILFGLGLALMTAGYLALLVDPSANKGGMLVAATALFGLVHGFGFASALQEAFSDQIQLGLRLAAFNIGVEAGQLLFVCLAGLAAHVLARGPAGQARLALFRPGAALTLCALGAYWFVDRAVMG